MSNTQCKINSADSHPQYTMSDDDDDDRYGLSVEYHNHDFDNGIPHFPAPTDRFNAVYAIFYFLGIGSLLPWNFFITAKPLRNVSSDDPQDQTSLQGLFENYLILASTLSTVFFQIINVFLTRSVSQKVRLTSACVAMILIFILTDVLTLLNTDKWQTGFFALTMLTVVISNAGGSMFSGASFGLASIFPPRYINGVMTGQAVGGSLSAVANVITIAAATDVETSAIAFFMSATVVLILCLLGYISLHYIRFSKYYIERHCTGIKAVVDFPETPESREPLIRDRDPRDPKIQYSVERENSWTLKEFLRHIFPYVVSVFLVFFVTLSVFPAMASSIVSVDRQSGSAMTNKYFSPLVCFLLFNLADFAGRTITTDIQLIKSHNSVGLLLLSMLRLAFIPLFLFCNLDNTRLPVVFDSDVYPVVFVTLMGLTNGYLGTLGMMYAPESVPLIWAELCGSVMFLSLTLGLAVGSGMSLGLMSIAQTTQ